MAWVTSPDWGAGSLLHAVQAEHRLFADSKHFVCVWRQAAFKLSGAEPKQPRAQRTRAPLLLQGHAAEGRRHSRTRAAGVRGAAPPVHARGAAGAGQ